MEQKNNGLKEGDYFLMEIMSSTTTVLLPGKLFWNIK